MYHTVVSIIDKSIKQEKQEQQQRQQKQQYSTTSHRIKQETEEERQRQRKPQCSATNHLARAVQRRAAACANTEKLIENQVRNYDGV